jgi:hypothetical protein
LSRPVIDRAKLLEVLRTVPPGKGAYAALATAYQTAVGGSAVVSPVTLRRTVHDLRQAGLTNWGSDDARLRPGALTTQLMQNAGRGFGSHGRHRIIQYLAAWDRREAGLPEGELRGAETFIEGLRAREEVIDLRDDGEPYMRPAKPWETGRLVVQMPPGKGPSRDLGPLPSL